MSDLNATTRVRADALLNRRRLFEAARDAIAVHGLEVSALDIAKVAGVGVGTLYRRFGTKDALLDTVVLGLYDELVEVAREQLNSSDAWDGLATFLMELAHAHRESKGLAEVTAACDREPGPEIAERTAALQDAVQRLTARAHASGDLRADVSWEDALLSSRASLSTDHCLGVDGGSDGWRRIMSLLLDGMRARPTGTASNPDHGEGPR